MMVDMAKGNITNVLPMILIGGWINWHYSGFITSKMPIAIVLERRKDTAENVKCLVAFIRLKVKILS